VADSIYILKGAQGGIDWDRLVGWAEKCHLTLPAREAIAYLRESFEAEVPDWVMRELNSFFVSPLEYRYYASAVAPQSALFGELLVDGNLYFLNRERTGQSVGIRAGLGFLPYLRRLKMMTRREFLGWLLSRVFFRVGSVMKRRDMFWD
jgi:hypothetical protein